MKTKHTPTPWTVEHATYENNRNGSIIFGNNGLEVCQLEGYDIDELEDNAKHIVKCVNMHDELVEALKDALRLIPVTDDTNDIATITRIYQLLNKAKGE